MPSEMADDGESAGAGGLSAAENPEELPVSSPAPSDSVNAGEVARAIAMSSGSATRDAEDSTTVAVDTSSSTPPVPQAAATSEPAPHKPRPLQSLAVNFMTR